MSTTLAYSASVSSRRTLARDAGDQGAGRDLGPLQDDRAGRDQAAGTHHRAVQHGGVHPDQAVVLDRAAVHHGAVPDADAGADLGREAVVGVDHGVVLEVAAGPELDRGHVGPDHRAVEDAGLRRHRGRPDDGRGRSQPGIGGDRRRVVAEGQDHGLAHGPTLAKQPVRRLPGSAIHDPAGGQGVAVLEGHEAYAVSGPRRRRSCPASARPCGRRRPGCLLVDHVGADEVVRAPDGDRAGRDPLHDAALEEQLGVQDAVPSPSDPPAGPRWWSSTGRALGRRTRSRRRCRRSRATLATPAARRWAVRFMRCSWSRGADGGRPSTQSWAGGGPDTARDRRASATLQRAGRSRPRSGSSTGRAASSTSALPNNTSTRSAFEFLCPALGPAQRPGGQHLHLGLADVGGHPSPPARAYLSDQLRQRARRSGPPVG